MNPDLLETLEDTFFSRAEQQGDDPVDSCWTWVRGRTSAGYGQFRHKYAHRLSWEFFNGPIPDGLTIDHLCHTRDKASCPGGAACPHRPCINPLHLDPVPRAVNASRAGGWTETTCKDGHSREEFERWSANGLIRYCRECRRLQQRARSRAAGARFMPSRKVRDDDV